MQMDVEVEKLSLMTQNCIFCHGSEIDEVRYGPVYKFMNIITHYYCMLLSPNLVQQGESCDEGLLGFLVDDILREVRRGKRLSCKFCKKKGASLGCVVKGCRVKFHLPCGLRNGTLHQFFGNYKSFCRNHRPKQVIYQRAPLGGETTCSICYEGVEPHADDSLWAPCCQRNTFFHRYCIQSLALSAGYLFRCPLCNNEELFVEEMKEFGVFVPERDAAWERVSGAYEDLLLRHDTCDSFACRAPGGRKVNRPGTRWELVLCKFCGSQGVHVGCGSLNTKSPEFTCSACSGNDLRTTVQGRRRSSTHGSGSALNNRKS